jgi:hypothetical protein
MWQFRAYALPTVVKSWKNGTSLEGGAEIKRYTFPFDKFWKIEV